MLTGTCSCGTLGWRYNGNPESTTACNCTTCRRYGALWVYGWEGDVIEVSGPSSIYSCGTRLEYHFCRECGCLGYYRMLKSDKQQRRTMAVNLRMIEDTSAFDHLPVYHFDGLNSFKYLPQDQRYAADMWF